MDSLSRQNAPPVDERIISQQPRRRGFDSWFRGLKRRIIFSILLFLLGVVVGAGGVFGYALFIAGNGESLITPPPPKGGNIVVQVDSSYIAHLVQINLQHSGMPGNIKNVGVALGRSEQMTITGDDELSLLGIGVTRHFALLLQTLAASCQLKMHVIHADFSGIPITGTVATFEDQVNSHIQINFDKLPQGFIYCTVGVRTNPNGLFITYSAKPQ